MKTQRATAQPYDYLVIGGGTAGCVVAARLAASPDVRVLLVEAGPRTSHWSFQMPSAFGRNFEGGRFNWAFRTTPPPELHNRRIFQPQGKVLRGSSAINGMVFLRGHPLDFDRWAFKEGPPAGCTRPSCPTSNGASVTSGLPVPIADPADRSRSIRDTRMALSTWLSLRPASKPVIRRPTMSTATSKTGSGAGT